MAPARVVNYHSVTRLVLRAPVGHFKRACAERHSRIVVIPPIVLKDSSQHLTENESLLSRYGTFNSEHK
jgi:hypothetical protein